MTGYIKLATCAIKGVMMLNKDLGLITRSHKFNEIISDSICTDTNGKVQELEECIHKFIKKLIYNREQGNSVYLIGNGGSAGIASHALTDFLNVCRLRAFTLHDSSLITCMANDFGYENAFSRILNTILQPQDILIAISSSGNSPNICNAAQTATQKKGIVVTFSGFQENNSLRSLGDINFWLNSNDYGLVEMGHQFILHNVADRFNKEYKKIQESKVIVSIA